MVRVEGLMGEESKKEQKYVISDSARGGIESSENPLLEMRAAG